MNDILQFLIVSECLQAKSITPMMMLSMTNAGMAVFVQPSRRMLIILPVSISDTINNEERNQVLFFVHKPKSIIAAPLKNIPPIAPRIVLRPNKPRGFSSKTSSVFEGKNTAPIPSNMQWNTAQNYQSIDYFIHDGC